MRFFLLTKPYNDLIITKAENVKILRFSIFFGSNNCYATE